MRKWILVLVVVATLGLGFWVVNNFNQNPANMDNLNPTDPPAEANSSQTSLTLVTPITHASMILNLGGQIIFNDPVGAELFKDQPTPNLILISDIHGDHFSAETLTAVAKEDTVIVVPQAVADLLPENLAGTQVVLNNGQKTTQKGIIIEAVPMYNVPETPEARHTKGRGNGYILMAEGKRIYVAGDTGPTEEMKALTEIDVAFVPMNPPFTMTVEEAAAAVVAFKPKVVYPYHYRVQGGALSDTNQFKELVQAKDPSIQVNLLNFYPDP